MSKLLCFKPLRTVHASGFRYIQYGYIDDDNNVEVVSEYDILQTPFMIPLSFRIDLTISGWFRILPNRDEHRHLKWKYGGEIAIVTPETKEDE